MRALWLGQAVVDEPLTLRLAPYLVVVALVVTALGTLLADVLVRARVDAMWLVMAAGGLRVIGRWVGSSRRASAVKWLVFAVVASIVGTGAVACSVGTFQIRSLVEAQGGYPWEWSAFRTPAAMVLACVGAVAWIDGPDTSEWNVVNVASVATEWLGVLLSVAIAVAVFLGGWKLPSVTAVDQHGSVALQMLGAECYLAKVWGTMALVVAARWALARVDLGEMIARTWVTIGAMMVLAVGAHIAWVMEGSRLPAVASRAIAGVTFGVAIGMVGIRVLQRMRGDDAAVDEVAAR